MKTTKTKIFKSDGDNSLGRFLAEARKKNGLSLERLGELTKIPLSHLQSLEAEKYDDLPPAVYRLGFFVRLAKFLGIGREEILRRCKDEGCLPDESLKGAPRGNGADYGFSFVLTPRKLIVGLGGIFLILAVSYLWYQSDFLIGPPHLVVANPSEDVLTSSEILDVSGKTDIGVYLTINGENVYVSPNGSFNKTVSLAKGLNVIEIKSRNRFDKTAAILKRVFRE